MLRKKMRIVFMAALAFCLVGAMGAQAAQAAKLLHRGQNVIHTRCGNPANPVILEVTAPRMTNLPGPCVLVVRPNCPAGVCHPGNIVVRVIHRFANQRPVQVFLRPIRPRHRCNLTVLHINRPVYANPCANPCVRPCVRPCTHPVPPVAIVPTPPRRPNWPHRPVHPDWVNPVGPPVPPVPGPLVDPFPPSGSTDDDIVALAPDHLEPNTNLPELGSDALNQGEIAPNPGIDISNPTLGHGTPVIPN